MAIIYIEFVHVFFMFSITFTFIKSIVRRIHHILETIPYKNLSMLIKKYIKISEGVISIWYIFNWKQNHTMLLLYGEKVKATACTNSSHSKSALDHLRDKTTIEVNKSTSHLSDENDISFNSAFKYIFKGIYFLYITVNHDNINIFTHITFTHFNHTQKILGSIIEILEELQSKDYKTLNLNFYYNKFRALRELLTSLQIKLNNENDNIVNFNRVYFNQGMFQIIYFLEIIVCPKKTDLEKALKSLERNVNINELLLQIKNFKIFLDELNEETVEKSYTLVQKKLEHFFNRCFGIFSTQEYVNPSKQVDILEGKASSKSKNKISFQQDDDIFINENKKEISEYTSQLDLVIDNDINDQLGIIKESITETEIIDDIKLQPFYYKHNEASNRRSENMAKSIDNKKNNQNKNLIKDDCIISKHMQKRIQPLGNDKKDTDEGSIVGKCDFLRNQTDVTTKYKRTVVQELEYICEDSNNTDNVDETVKKSAYMKKYDNYTYKIDFNKYVLDLLNQIFSNFEKISRGCIDVNLNFEACNYGTDLLILKIHEKVCRFFRKFCHLEENMSGSFSADIKFEFNQLYIKLKLDIERVNDNSRIKM